MAIVHIPAGIRTLTGGETTANVPGRTLGEIVESLEAAYPGLKSRLVEEERIRRGLATFIDGISASPNLNTRVGDDAEIYFAPAVAGG